MDTITRIIACVKEKKITQVQLAEHLKEKGVKKQTITDWKSGKSNTYYELIDEIAKYFGVTTEWLLTGKEQIMANEVLSMEMQELLKIYTQLDGKGRIELIAFAHNELKRVSQENDLQKKESSYKQNQNRSIQTG